MTNEIPAEFNRPVIQIIVVWAALVHVSSWLLRLGPDPIPSPMVELVRSILRVESSSLDFNGATLKINPSTLSMITVGLDATVRERWLSRFHLRTQPQQHLRRP